MAGVEGCDREIGVRFSGEVGPGAEELTAADAVGQAVVDRCAEEHATTAEGSSLKNKKQKN